MKKRIPLKKGGPGGANGKVNNSSFQDASQSAPGSRKQSIKRAGDHLVSSYLGPAGMNPKQSIESTFSYNINKPNLQKYLKQNRSMIQLRDPKKRVQSVTVVPTRNTTLQKADRAQRSNINQRASSINSTLPAPGAALRSYQPQKITESMQKQRKKPQTSTKSPGFVHLVKPENH